MDNRSEARPGNIAFQHRCPELIERMHTYIDKTKTCALRMVVHRTNFLCTAFHLIEMKVVLECMAKETDFLCNSSAELPLLQLSEIMKDFYDFTHECSVRSRILLVYCSDCIVAEIKSYISDIKSCLTWILTSVSDMSVKLRDSIQSMQAKFITSDVCQEPHYSDLAREISSCMEAANCDAPSATTLLLRVANRLKVPEFEAVELKKELENDLEKCNLIKLELAGAVRALNQLFSPAQPLGERRRLASVNCPPLFSGRTSIPSSFFCPITKSLMKEPVTLGDEGYTYEKEAILEWFDGGHKTCPDTGKEVESLVLIPNVKLQQVMNEYFDHLYQAQLICVLENLKSPIMGSSVDEDIRILESITNLGPKFKELAFSLDVVEVLVGLLKKSDSSVQGAIIKVLIDISVMGDAHKLAIVEAGTILLLLQMLQENPTENKIVNMLLLELSKIEIGKRAIVSVDGFMRIIGSHGSEDIKKLVGHLCTDDSVMVIEAARFSFFDPLISAFNNGDIKTKLEILTAVFNNLEKKELSSVGLVNAGIVPPLLRLLQSAHSECISTTIKILLHLSNKEQNRVHISKAGAIPVIIKFLAYPDYQIRIDATSILSNLATHKEYDYEIDSEGTVIRMFSMMKSRDNALQEYSLKTLEYLTKDSETVRNQVVESGMIPIFYAILESQKISLMSRRSVLNILYNVIDKCDRVLAVLPSAGVINYLVSLLEFNNSSEETEAILGILKFLVTAGETNSIVLSDDKLLVLCLENLKQGDLNVQQTASGLLCEFVRSRLMEPSFFSILIMHDIIYNLKSLIDNLSSSECAKKHAAETLYLLSSSTPHLVTHESTMLSNCLSRMGLKKSKWCRVHGRNCRITKSFCLIGEGIVPSLINLTKGNGEESTEWAVKLFSMLVSSSQQKEKTVDFLIENGLLDCLVILVAKCRSGCRESLDLLETIFKFPKYQQQKYSNAAKSALMEFMSSGVSELKEQAASVLLQLDVKMNN